MAGFSDMAIDPKTGKAKVKAAPGGGTGTQTQTTLPYIDPKNPDALLPNVQQASNTGLQQGSNQVLATAQNKAMSGAIAQDPIAGKTSEMVQKMQSDPSFGYQGDQYKANFLSNFDYNQANAVKDFKEQNADLGGHGETNSQLMKTILSGNIDRSNLENTINMQNIDRAKQDWADAIAAGNTQTTQNAALEKSAIDNLLGVRSGYEGEANRQSSEKVAEWNVDLEKWKTEQSVNLTRQGWTEESARQKTQIDADALQGSLDRALEKTLADLNLGMEYKKLAQAATQAADELSFKRWATQSGYDDSAAARVWQASQNAIKIASEEKMNREALDSETYNKELDRALTKEIEGGRIAQTDRELAQRALLASDELVFKREALKSGVDEARANQIWQSAENAKDRAQAMVISTNQIDLETRKLTSSIDQFNKNYGLESSKYMASIDQWQQEFGQKVQAWEAATGLHKHQLAQELQIANSQMANQVTLANIDAAAREKGLDLSAVLDNIGELPSDVAASTLVQVMKKAGLDTTGVAESIKNAQNTPLPMIFGQTDSPTLTINPDGGIVTPDGSMYLADGQSVTLESNFKAQSGVIPAGKYTVRDYNGVKTLIDQNGKAYQLGKSPEAAPTPGKPDAGKVVSGLASAVPQIGSALNLYNTGKSVVESYDPNASIADNLVNGLKAAGVAIVENSPVKKVYDALVSLFG